MDEIHYDAHSEQATQLLGTALAECLSPGTTVALCGTLGAGKTYLVKAIAVAMGVDPEQVISPTFVLCREYEGQHPLYHLDAYRIRDDDEFLELGPEEYFDSTGITFVEWADRVSDCLPRDHLEINIEPLAATARRFHIRAQGPDSSAVIEALRDRLGLRVDHSPD
jgi:tRNA threonylcarbamoyladenosine biosynthesis protein TsaE